MSDWNTLSYEEKAAKARRAAEALESAGWLFDEVVADRLDAIKNSPQTAADKRETIYQEIHAIEILRAHLAGYGQAMALETARVDKRKE